MSNLSSNPLILSCISTKGLLTPSRSSLPSPKESWFESSELAAMRRPSRKPQWTSSEASDNVATPKHYSRRSEARSPSLREMFTWDLQFKATPLNLQARKAQPPHLQQRPAPPPPLQSSKVTPLEREAGISKLIQNSS